MTSNIYKEILIQKYYKKKKKHNTIKYIYLPILNNTLIQNNKTKSNKNE